MKAGTFTFEDMSLPDIDAKLNRINYAISLVKRYVLKESKWIETFKFKTALMSFFKNPEVEYDVFERKIAYKADSLHACADVYGYYMMIRDIYNWKNMNPVGARLPEDAGKLEVAGQL